MHVTSVAVILALTCIASTLSLPTAAKRDDVEIVPLEKNPFGTQPIVDTGFFGGWNEGPFSNPFGGIFEGLESIMTRMRQQMDAILKRFPLSRGNSSAEIPDFSLEGGLPPFPEFGDIDLGKGNSTSITKVIDGHKVVINETEYKKDGDFGGTYFKVKIIDVKPDSAETTTTQSEASTPSPTNSVKEKESVENSAENEIFKSKEIQSGQPQNPNTMDLPKYQMYSEPLVSDIQQDSSVSSNQQFQYQEQKAASNQNNIEIYALGGSEVEDLNSLPAYEVVNGGNTQNSNTEWEDLGAVETFGDNSINPDAENTKPFDLSRDTYVNQLLAESGAPTNPDAEVFFVPQQTGDNQQDPIRFEKFNNPR